MFEWVPKRFETTLKLLQKDATFLKLKFIKNFMILLFLVIKNQPYYPKGGGGYFCLKFKKFLIAQKR